MTQLNKCLKLRLGKIEKKLLEIIIGIFLAPFFIIINPITIEIFKKIRQFFWTVFYSWIVDKKFSSFHSETYIELTGAKYIRNKGKVILSKHNKIQCISKYGKQQFSPSFVIGDNVFLLIIVASAV